MWEIIKRLQATGVALQIVNLGIDTANPTGKLMLNVLSGVAKFEREMMLEREGIQKAKAEGKYKGRKPTARAKAEKVNRLASERLSMGQLSMGPNCGQAPQGVLGG